MKDLQIVLFPNGIVINSKPSGSWLFLESVHLGEELRHCCWEENNLKMSTHETMPCMGWQQDRAWASPQANPPMLSSLGLQPRNLTVDVSYCKFFFLPFTTHIFLPQYPARTLLTPLKVYLPVFESLPCRVITVELLSSFQQSDCCPHSPCTARCWPWGSSSSCFLPLWQPSGTVPTNCSQLLVTGLCNPVCERWMCGQL